MRLPLEVQHKHSELLIIWQLVDVLFVSVLGGHCYDEDWIMSWPFAAEQLLQRLLAGHEGDILSFTENLKGVSWFLGSI